MPDEGHKGETGSDRSSAGAADPTSRAAPSLVILGADALLAAQPATAVQLAHACLRIGYHAVVPASWGDELIASGCLKHLASRRSAGDTGPAIFCACPYVAYRLLAVGPELEPFLASFVAPPVAVASYLRTLYEPTRLRLTYVGRCPGAADDTIDARLSPDELLAVIAERGIELAEQPRVFDSVIPPDRRRFLSQPGGLPSPDLLRRADPERRVVEVTGPELAPELAQHLLSGANVLIDVAPRLGCACSGAIPGTAAAGARVAVAQLEPPRAASPVVDDRVPIAIELPLPVAARNPIDIVPSVTAKRTSGALRAVPPPDQQPATPSQARPEPGTPGGRRRSPAHGVTVRQPTSAVPTTRSGEGRALPRAYVARRGTGSRGRGPSTPPRGEARQRLDASGGAGGRGGRGADRGIDRGSQRGGGSGTAASTPPTRLDWAEDAERAERVERPERGRAEGPPDRAEVPPAAMTPSAVAAGGGELRVSSTGPRTAAATIGAAPDHAADPHGDLFGFNIPDEVAEEAARTAAELYTPATITEARTAPAASFRVRSAKLARMAVGAAHGRRAMVAALLAVALLSASVGVLAGRWLAARTGESTPAGERR